MSSGLRGRRWLATVPIIAALFTAAGTVTAAQRPAPRVKPQLLLFHGGSFLYTDDLFTELSRPRAIRAGFVPHYVDYPLGNLPAAVRDARAAARRLDARYGVEHVYAYGSSAGGLFSSLLAQEGLVAGAVAKAPPVDLVAWKWPDARYGAGYYREIHVRRSELARYSPARHRFRDPLLIYQGTHDRIVLPAMNRRLAAKSPMVFFRGVPGGHWVDRERPRLIYKAMVWLGHLAAYRIAAGR